MAETDRATLIATVTEALRLMEECRKRLNLSMALVEARAAMDLVPEYYPGEKDGLTWIVRARTARQNLEAALEAYRAAKDMPIEWLEWLDDPNDG